MMEKQLSLFDFKPQSTPIVVLDYLDIEGLRYCEDFLTRDEQLKILAAVDSHEWLNDLKRRVQHYGYKYDYKARKVDPTMFVGPLPGFATQIANKLVELELISTLPDQLIVNEYQPGQGIYPHIDCEPCFQDEIATVSLGSQYTMNLTELDGNRTVAVPLPVGSCLVFSGVSRYEWTHGIKPRLTDNGQRRGRRISLTFRKVILSKLTS